MLKGSICQDITILKWHVPNNRDPKYMKQKLTELKEEIDNETIIVGDFGTWLSIMDETSRQKIDLRLMLCLAIKLLEKPILTEGPTAPRAFHSLWGAGAVASSVQEAYWSALGGWWCLLWVLAGAVVNDACRCVCSTHSRVYWLVLLLLRRYCISVTLFSSSSKIILSLFCLL